MFLQHETKTEYVYTDRRRQCILLHLNILRCYLFMFDEIFVDKTSIFSDQIKLTKQLYNKKNSCQNSD